MRYCNYCNSEFIDQFENCPMCGRKWNGKYIKEKRLYPDIEARRSEVDFYKELAEYDRDEKKPNIFIDRKPANVEPAKADSRSERKTTGWETIHERFPDIKEGKHVSYNEKKSTFAVIRDVILDIFGIIFIISGACSIIFGFDSNILFSVFMMLNGYSLMNYAYKPLREADVNSGIIKILRILIPIATFILMGITAD